MKEHCATLSLAILMVVLATECRAGFSGCDNFNDNSIDASRWSGPVVYSGVGWLTETNNRLEFTTTNTPTGSEDRCSLTWVPNTGSYTQDWELKVDVNIGIPVFASASPQPGVGLYLLVVPSNQLFGPNNMFLVQFGQDTSKNIGAQVWSNGAKTVVATTNTSATNLALRVTFDSSAKVLSAFFDEDAANCGYSWQPLGSTAVPANWGMTTNTFSALLSGGGKNVAIASTNNVFFDNFGAASGPIPRLQIASQGNGVAMWWPTNTPDFQLESTTTLSAPICWSAVTNVATTVATNFTVTDLISTQTKFFRLSRIYGCQ